jgi:hypothetical protein
MPLSAMTTSIISPALSKALQSRAAASPVVSEYEKALQNGQAHQLSKRLKFETAQKITATNEPASGAAPSSST